MFNPVFLSRFQHSCYAPQALNFYRNPSSEKLSVQSMEPHQSNCWWFGKHLTTRSLDNAARANGAKGRQIPFKCLPFHRFLIVTISSNRSPFGVTVYRSGRSETNVSPTASLGLIPVRCKYPFYPFYRLRRLPGILFPKTTILTYIPWSYQQP